MAFEVIGHRGAAGHAPENTAAAFQLALAMDVDAIELDVQLTRDQRVVVFHDRQVDRTTNGSGPVAAHTAAEIKALDAGGWFDASYQGERVLFIDEALRLIGGRVPVVAELKADDHWEELVQKTVSAWDDAGRPAILFSSFFPGALQVAKDVAPDIARAWLMAPARVSLDEALRTAQDIALTQLCPRAVDIDAAWCERAHRAGYGVRAWGLPGDDLGVMKQVMRKLVRDGVDGCTADYPDLLRTTCLAEELISEA